jgi:glucosyl-dolichyl phosphate glucuronosyltransferase
MNISVILCTYNRAESLKKALESMAASEVPASLEWEVLLVDNNSSDFTSAVGTEFCRRFPGRFRYLHVAQQGKSRALNVGVHEAKGSVLIFADDDVTVEPSWLRNLSAPLLSGQWAGAGGRTLPDHGFSRPGWLSDRNPNAMAPLGLFDRGQRSYRLLEAPYGNNMAFLKSMFEKHGDFRSDLGPRPGARAPQKCEDSEFAIRLLRAGEALVYEPSAVLYHSVPQERLRKQYFLDWWFDKNRADLQAFGLPPDSGWTVAGIPLAAIRRLGRWTLQWLFTLNSAARFDCKLKVWGLFGLISECRSTAQARQTE